MRTSRATKVVSIGILAAGWLVGGLTQLDSDLRSGYTGVSIELIMFGGVLCAWSGVVARVVGRVPRRVRAGAVAGVATIVAIVASKEVMELLIADRLVHAGTGETWFSFLLEAWFWIGVPLVSSAACGAFGWLLADTLLRGGSSGATTSSTPRGSSAV